MQNYHQGHSTGVYLTDFKTYARPYCVSGMIKQGAKLKYVNGAYAKYMAKILYFRFRKTCNHMWKLYKIPFFTLWK